MTIVAVTGHRPNKLYGYNFNHPGWCELRKTLKVHLKDLEAHQCISGMALGVDLVFAQAALELGIPLEAAIPCRNQEKVWSYPMQKLYHQILAQATTKTLVSDADYSPHLMQVRNQYMVDKCHVLIAVWDGSKGGTANCVQYAKERNTQIIHLTPPKITKLQPSRSLEDMERV